MWHTSYINKYSASAYITSIRYAHQKRKILSGIFLSYFKFGHTFSSNMVIYFHIQFALILIVEKLLLLVYKLQDR